jgi:hypothetical protein
MKILTRYSIDCCNDGKCIEEDSLGSWVKFSDVMEAQNTDVQQLKRKIAELREQALFRITKPIADDIHVVFGELIRQLSRY